MILADLDAVLRELLLRELTANGIGDVAITFDAPSRERSAEWPSPAINAFLYDLREAPDARDRALHPATVAGRDILVRAPVRLACTYAITAWTRTPLDEHRLLSQAMAILLSHPRLPVDLLTPSLLVGTPSFVPTTEVGHTREDARSEFWTAVGGQYKVSLEYTVTLLCDPGIALERGPLAKTAVIETTDRQRGPRPAGEPPVPPREVTYSCGGEVHDEAGQPLPQIAVSVLGTGAVTTTDELGRFVLPAVPAGPQTVQARGAAGQLVQAAVEIPGDALALMLPAVPARG